MLVSAKDPQKRKKLKASHGEGRERRKLRSEGRGIKPGSLSTGEKEGTQGAGVLTTQPVRTGRPENEETQSRATASKNWTLSYQSVLEKREGRLTNEP